MLFVAVEQRERLDEASLVGFREGPERLEELRAEVE